jgi:hypothetical protein
MRHGFYNRPKRYLRNKKRNDNREICEISHISKCFKRVRLSFKLCAFMPENGRRQWRTKEFFREGGGGGEGLSPVFFFAGGSTNSVEDSAQKERGSGGGTP